MIPVTPPKRPVDFTAALAKPDIIERPVIQELLYEGETTFVVADPAVGKSTLATQMALHLTNATPAFDIFEVAEPTTVYYIALETRWSRQVRTIRHMMKVFPANLENLRWDSPVGMDLTHKETGPTDMALLIRRIKAEWPRVGVVIVDPLYLTCSEDLKDGKSGRAISSFLNQLSNETGCSNLVLHHTHREKYSVTKGQRIEEDDPIYGSRWLKAHAALSFYVTPTATGTLWKVKKDRFKLTRHQFQLTYDSNTFTSSGAIQSRSSVSARIQRILSLTEPGTCLTYNDIAAKCGNALNYVKAVMTDPVFLKFAERIDHGSGKPVEWRVRQRQDQPQPEAEI